MLKINLIELLFYIILRLLDDYCKNSAMIPLSLKLNHVFDVAHILSNHLLNHHLLLILILDIMLVVQHKYHINLKYLDDRNNYVIKQLHQKTKSLIIKKPMKIIQFCIFLMYTNPLFFQDFIHKKGRFGSENSQFWTTADCRPSSMPVDSRTLGIVQCAPGMVTTQ